MKLGYHALAMILGFGLVAPAVAQEDTKKDEPAKEEAAAPAAPAKELSGCAKSFVPLADSYKAAYDDMQKWISQIDTQTAAASDNVAKLQKQLDENQAAVTQAKSSNDKAKAKDLDKAGKKISGDLNTAKKDLSSACSKLVKDAPDKVKQYADATNKALDALKSQGK